MTVRHSLSPNPFGRLFNAKAQRCEGAKKKNKQSDERGITVWWVPVDGVFLYRWQSQLGVFAPLQCYLRKSFRSAKLFPVRGRSLARSALLVQKRLDNLTTSLPFTRCDRGPVALHFGFGFAALCLRVEFRLHRSG